jgi:hypothetical protein
MVKNPKTKKLERRPDKATGVNKVLLEAFYNKGVRKDNLTPWTKKKNISVKDFLEVMGVVNNKSVRSDRNTSARVQALAVQTGKLLTNQAVREQLEADGKPIEALQVIGDGRSSYVWSTSQIPGKNLKGAGRVDASLNKKGLEDAKAIFWNRIPDWATFFGNEEIYSLDKDAIKISLKEMYSDIPAIVENIDNIANAIYFTLKRKPLRKDPIMRTVDILDNIYRSNELAEKKLAAYFRVNESFRDIQSNKDRVERARGKTKQYALERWEELNERYKDDPELAVALWYQEMREIEKHSTSSGRIADRRFIPDPNNPIKVILNPEYPNLQKKLEEEYQDKIKAVKNDSR